MEDAQILFRWKNDKATIENSITGRGVTMEEHLGWLKKVIENPNRHLFILEVEGHPAGQLRLDLEEMSQAGCIGGITIVTGEISYGLGEEFRGMGLGRLLLEQAENEARKLRVSVLTAEVLPHNKASQSLFRKLGYVEKITANLYEYRKEIGRIYIRADMNEVIATGHVMRCLSIADAAKKLGRETVFIVADEKPLELLKTRGYEAIVLHSDWKNMEEELEKLIPILNQQGITKLLVDSYQVTEKYLTELEKHTEVFYLDDVDAFEYPVSNVICYANYYSKLSYANYKKDTEFYLGTSYMPLREVYQNCKPKQIKENIEKIMVLSGGSDSYCMLEKIADLFKNENKLQLDIICGAFYPDFEGLKDKFVRYPQLHFYQNVSNLDEFMEKADLAISAGGTTLYELCAKGTPTISYSFADNQLNNVQQFDEEGIIEYAGDVRFDDVFTQIYKLYEKYEASELRKSYSEKMQHVMDGKGASRIAAIL